MISDKAKLFCVLAFTLVASGCGGGSGGNSGVENLDVAEPQQLAAGNHNPIRPIRPALGRTI